MIFKTLLIITALVGTIHAVSLDEFFPYGLTANDQLFPANDDSSTTALLLSRTFPYFNNNHRQIYLANNGLFSFLTPISQFVPDPFPLNGNLRLIAGFWSDIDTSGDIPGGNQVYYHIYDDPSSSTVFEKATSYVRQYYPGERSFSPTMIITGTWYRVGAFPSQTNLTNTFQIVLVTDEIRSFAFLLYHDLQWANPQNDDGAVSGQAGFNAGDGVVFEMLPYSRTSSVRQLVNISNVNVPGLFVFRIDTDAITVGGCGNDSRLLFRPRRGSQLGYTPITIQGPCFTNISGGAVKCRFGEFTVVDAIVFNELQAICLSPPVPLSSFVPLYLSLDGGATFQLFPNTFMYTPAEYGLSLTNNAELMIDNRRDVHIITAGDELTLKWYLSETTMNSWSNNSIRLEVQMVTVVLSLSNGGIVENSTRVLSTNLTPVLGQQTTSIITPPIDNGVLPTIFFRIVARNTMTNLIYMGLNSALFVLHDNAVPTTGYCQAWASNEPLPSTWNQDLLPCPLTLAQARVARCCYERDLTCMENSLDPVHNCQLRRGRPEYDEVSAIACYLSLSTNQRNAGAECCYGAAGQLITRGLGGGTDDRYQPASSPVLHFFGDTLPFFACCLLTTDRESCTRYFNLRPFRRGSNTQNGWGSGWGDPHFVTLDRSPYTFNGYGEYTYLAVAHSSTPINAAFSQSEQSLVFSAQVRTTPLVLPNGTTIANATVIRGLAARSNHPLAERMSITVSRRELLIVRRGNETLDLDADSDDALYSDHSLLLFFPEMTLERNRTSGVLTLSWHIGISIQVTPVTTNLSTSNSPLVLNIGVSVSDAHKNRTFGLLGLYDNDPANDFRARNGSILVLNDPFALREIHYSFGETWLIASNDSLFYYETGDSASFYATQNTLYEPSFSLPDPSITQTNSTYQICNIDPSSSNQSAWTFAQRTCYYDIAVTNDLSFGQASKLAGDTAVQISNDQRSSPEFNLALPLVIAINGSTNLVLNFTATSPYSSTILYTLLQGPSGATFDNQKAIFNWQTPSSTENDVIVRVTAQDGTYNLLTTHELAVRINAADITIPVTGRTSRSHIGSILWIFVFVSIIGMNYLF